jgi:hypothetical protein
MVVAACSGGGEKARSTNSAVPPSTGIAADQLATSDSALGVTAAAPAAKGAASSRRPGAAGAAQSTSAVPRTAKLPIAPGTHGVTDTTIQIGLPYVDSAAFSAATKALAVGGGSTEPGGTDDVRNLAIAFTKYINSHGGVAGRNIELVWHKVDIQNLLSKQGRIQEAQSACTDWTQDHHVFAISDWLGTFVEGDLMLQCALDAKTPLVNPFFGTGTIVSNALFAKGPNYYYGLGGFLAERRERAYAQGLLDAGFFTKGAKVGILVEDVPAIRDGVDHELIPFLARHGINVVARATYPDPISSPWSNYVLQFQQTGATHVLLSDASSVLRTWLFMRAADNQGFRPRYGLSSQDSPAALPENVPATQLTAAVAVGWFPIYDDTNWPAPPVSSTDAVCRAALKEQGFNNSNSAGNSFCGVALFLQAAFAAAKTVSPAGLAAGAESLGTSWVYSLTYGGAAKIARGRHDTAASMRLLAYDGGCGCFKYTSAAKPID